LDEKLRLALEPRTASAKKRLNTIKTLAENNIPVGVMTAPIIPGLNSQEIPALIKTAADHGASGAGFTIVRLNGSIAEIFEDWIRKAFPDKADKVLHMIAACHNGKLNDSKFGTRMRGEGEIAESIRSLFKLSCKKYFKESEFAPLNHDAFVRNPDNKQLKLF
jgi:DNA repair photolyase